jgi:hypothetical protein
VRPGLPIIRRCRPIDSIFGVYAPSRHSISIPAPAQKKSQGLDAVGAGRLQLVETTMSTKSSAR